jgi:hypothetical protein
MADVNINKYRASVIRSGSTPATPGYVASEGQNPVDPSGSAQNHLPVTINPTATGLSITDSQILSGAGTVGQYIRGDGSLADFPSITGGGSSVSYYLNGSVSQGTIGGVAYKELNRTPVFGTGTDISISADGYIASFITDAGDPNKLEIPAGNWNFETYFSASSSGGSPSFYVELYKYNGTTFTLIASSSSSPELIAFGTNLNPYFSTLAVPQTALALTDRLAVRFYVTHSGRTITLHTENNHLCQIITSFTTGLTALNNLTSQVQFFAVGTSGSDFNIASSVDTHTFNLPTASASNRGALSSADWSTFNNKENAITAGTTAQYFRGDKTFQTLNTSVVPEGTNLYYTEARVNANTNVAANTAARHNAVTLGTANGLSLSTQVLSLGLASAGVTGALSGTDWSTFNSKQNALTLTTTGTSGAATLVGSTLNIPQYQAAGTYVTAVTASSPLASSGGTTPNITIQQASGSQNGFLSSTDWTTFNSKQNALTNPVTGTGTTNYLPKFTGTSTIGNSQVFDNGTNVGIGTTSPLNKLSVVASNSSGYYNRTEAIGVFHGSLPTVLIANDGNAPDQYAELKLGNNQTTYYPYSAYIRGVQGSGIDQYRLEFGTSSGVATTTKMTLTTGGNLLVGTTTDAGYKLDVNGTGRFSNRLFVDGNLSGNNIAFLKNASSNGYGLLIQGGNSSNYALFITDYLGTQIFQMLGNGAATFSSRVGVAGAAATYPITVYNASNGTTAAFGGTARGIRIDNDGTFSSGRSTIFGVDSSFYGSYQPMSIEASSLSLQAVTGGNVLIGTTTDNGNRLQVNGAGGIRVNEDGSSTKVISIRSDFAGVDPAVNVVTNNSLLLMTNNTERMRITSGGNVGIGTSSIPNAISGTETVLKISNSNIASLYFESTGAGGIANYINTSRALVWYDLTAGAERMRINSSGNVGIGTSSPSDILNLAGGASGSYGLVIDNSKVGGGVKAHFQYDADNQIASLAGITTNGLVFKTLTAGNVTEKMRITAGGRVGIGQTSPDARLHVEVPAESPATGAVALLAKTSNGANDIFRWFDGSTQLGVFKNNGNVGIGTSSPSTALHVVSNDNSANRTSPYNVATITATSANAPYNGFGTGLVFAATHYNGLVYNGARIRNVLNDNSIVSLGNSIAFDVTATRGGTLTEAMKIDYNGNVGIGTSSPASKLHVLGSGTVSRFESSISYVDFQFINTTSSAGYIQYNGNNFNIFANSGSTPTMTITGGSPGNVLIGTQTDNGNRLRVNGVGFFDQGVRTGQPVGTTTNNWLLGRALASGTSTPNRWIRVQIGLEYYDILAVYMGTL